MGVFHFEFCTILGAKLIFSSSSWDLSSMVFILGEHILFKHEFICVCARMHIHEHTMVHIWRSGPTAFRRWVSPTMWVLRIELGLSGLLASPFTHGAILPAQNTNVLEAKSKIFASENVPSLSFSSDLAID